MNRLYGTVDHAALYVPRVRGDEPMPTVADFVSAIMFPTCVGMNRGGIGENLTMAHVPHVRGDEPRLLFST